MILQKIDFSNAFGLTQNVFKYEKDVNCAVTSLGRRVLNWSKTHYPPHIRWKLQGGFWRAGPLTRFASFLKAFTNVPACDCVGGAVD